jgi:hypothetical protein
VKPDILLDVEPRCKPHGLLEFCICSSVSDTQVCVDGTFQISQILLENPFFSGHQMQEVPLCFMDNSFLRTKIFWCVHQRPNFVRSDDSTASCKLCWFG